MDVDGTPELHPRREEVTCSAPAPWEEPEDRGKLTDPGREPERVRVDTESPKGKRTEEGIFARTHQRLVTF